MILCVACYTKNNGKVNYNVESKVASNLPEYRQVNRKDAIWTTHLTDHDVAEFWWQWENPEKFDFTQSRLQQLIVCCHGVVSDVVMTCDATKLSNLHSARKV